MQVRSKYTTQYIHMYVYWGACLDGCVKRSIECHSLVRLLHIRIYFVSMNEIQSRVTKRNNFKTYRLNNDKPNLNKHFFCYFYYYYFYFIIIIIIIYQYFIYFRCTLTLFHIYLFIYFIINIFVSVDLKKIKHVFLCNEKL